MTADPRRSPPLDADAPEIAQGSLGEQLRAALRMLPGTRLTLGTLLEVFGDEGLLLLCALLCVVFLIPVSIPGVSTVFGAAMLMVGVSRLFGRELWLPRRLRERALPTERILAALDRGLVWVNRLERISRPHRLTRLAGGRGADLVNNLAFISAVLLLMAPFGLIPFSNTLPALAVLLYAIGMIQRDGLAILLGHAMQLATLAYFALLIGGGGLALHQLWQRLVG